MKAIMQSNLESLVIKFVSDVKGIVREELYRTLNQTLSDTTHMGTTAAVTRALGRDALSSRGKSEKRTPAQLEKLQTAIIVTLRNSPGIGIEELANIIDCPSKELVLPITKLRLQKKISRKGLKRATKYTLTKRV